MPSSSRVRFGDLGPLPEPVRAYLTRTLREGAPLVTGAAVTQRGEILMGDAPGSWRPFVARQLFSTLRPGFVWDARVRLLPWLPQPLVQVRDCYVDGRGATRATLLSRPLANAEGSAAIDEAALQRYLAEALWFPTALLPSDRVQWTAVDATHAVVTLVDGDVRASLQIEFNADGEPISCYTPSRVRAQGDSFVRLPWGGTLSQWATRDGMRVPLECEVYWVVDGTRRPYFRARNVEVTYTFITTERRWDRQD